MRKQLPCLRCGASVKSESRDCPKCGKVLIRVIADRFELRDCLHFADTEFALYAWDRLDKREVFIRATLPTAGSLVTNALSMEANVLQELADHPSVPAFVYGGKLYETGGLYLAQEFVVGKRLDLALDALAPIERVKLIRQAMTAVAPLHERGLVHCNLALESFVLTPDGRVVLLDFRQTRSAGDPSGQSGKEGYLAPEQRSALSPVSPATDIFALGSLAYQGLTGKRPYPRTLDKSLGARWPLPRKPSEVSTEISDDIDETILRALAYEPSKRFATANELHEALVKDSGRDTVVDALPYDFPSRLQIVNENLIAGAVLVARTVRRFVWACVTAIYWYGRAVASITGVRPTVALASTAAVLSVSAILSVAFAHVPSSPKLAVSSRAHATLLTPSISHTDIMPASSAWAADTPHAKGMAFIRFLTWPPANAYLDGRYIVEAPSSKLFLLPAGPHRLRLVSKRSGERWISLELKAGGSYMLTFDFDASRLNLKEIDLDT